MLDFYRQQHLFLRVYRELPQHHGQRSQQPCSVQYLGHSSTIFGYLVPLGTCLVYCKTSSSSRAYTYALKRLKGLLYVVTFGSIFKLPSMIEIMHHLIHVYMYYTARIALLLVYEVYTRSCMISTIKSMMVRGACGLLDSTWTGISSLPRQPSCLPLDPGYHQIRATRPRNKDTLGGLGA